jgi:hypothetical protein
MSRNDDLKRYTELQLQIQIDALESEREILRSKLLAVGNHVTSDFLCTVTVQERRQLPGIKTLESHADIWGLVAPLVTVREVLMVKVQPKGRIS